MKKYSPKILLHRTYFQRLKAVIWKSSSTAILAMNISKVLALACLIIFSGREDGRKKTTVFFNSKVVLQGICEILPPLPIILISSLINKLSITLLCLQTKMQWRKEWGIGTLSCKGWRYKPSLCRMWKEVQRVKKKTWWYPFLAQKNHLQVCLLWCLSVHWRSWGKLFLWLSHKTTVLAISTEIDSSSSAYLVVLHLITQYWS